LSLKYNVLYMAQYPLKFDRGATHQANFMDMEKESSPLKTASKELEPVNIKVIGLIRA